MGSQIASFRAHFGVRTNCGALIATRRISPLSRMETSNMTIESSNATVESFTEHTIRRLHVRLDRPYDDAIAEFERVVPPIDLPRFQALENWEENLRLFETVAPLGLMRFGSIDVLAFTCAKTSSTVGTSRSSNSLRTTRMP
jgi:hypothetical protein